MTDTVRTVRVSHSSRQQPKTVYSHSLCKHCGKLASLIRGQCVKVGGVWYEKRTCRSCQSEHGVICLPYQVRILEVLHDDGKVA